MVMVVSTKRNTISLASSLLILRTSTISSGYHHIRAEFSSISICEARTKPHSAIVARHRFRRKGFPRTGPQFWTVKPDTTAASAAASEAAQTPPSCSLSSSLSSFSTFSSSTGTGTGTGTGSHMDMDMNMDMNMDISDSGEAMMLSFPEFLSKQKQAEIGRDVQQQQEEEEEQQQQPPPQPQHFVLGNQAGDADSLVSSLALAYVDYLLLREKKTTKTKTTTTKTPKESGDDRTIVPKTETKTTPILSIPRADLGLRQETMLLLRLARLSTSSLLFADDQCFRRARSPLVTLVDHNRLFIPNVESTSNKSNDNNEEEQEEDWKVIRIFDHHMDEGYHKEHGCVGENRIIAFDYESGRATVASTCTLVTERLMTLAKYAEADADADPELCENNHHNNNENSMHPIRNAKKQPLWIPTDLAIALVGVILLDTVNRSPMAGKVTDRDVKALDFLLRHTDWTTLSDPRFLKETTMTTTTTHKAAATLDLDTLYHHLQTSKTDPVFWDRLSVTDALRLDYKTFQVAAESASASASAQTTTTTSSVRSFGASSILMPLTDFLSKKGEDGVAEQMDSFMKSRGDLPLLVILTMTMMVDDNGQQQPRREMAIVSREEDLLDRVVNFLLTDNEAASSSSSSFSLSLKTRIPKKRIYSGRGDNSNNDDEIDDDSPSSAATTTTTTLFLHTFDQGNPKASRKQVVPILMEFFQHQ